MVCFAGLDCLVCPHIAVLIALQSDNSGSKVTGPVQEAVAVMEQQLEEERQQLRVEREAAEQKVAL